MIDNLMVAAALSAALGSGLMAGLFFAFSNFVMKALASVAPERGIASMQAINVTVLNPLFLLVFLGTALACVGALLYASLHRQHPAALWLVAGSVLYLVGVVLVTLACNVPRNDALAAVDPASPDSVAAWTAYVAGWTAWNHVRTVTAFAAAGAFIVAFCHLRAFAE